MNNRHSTTTAIHPLTGKNSVISWILQLVAAAILFQTLFFKFTGAEESVYIFTRLGAEPWGRVGSGVVELIAGILLLVPRTVPLGALIAFGVMGGAIASHLTRLGIVVQNDGGLLFALAVVVLLATALLLVLRREYLRQLLNRVRTRFESSHPTRSGA
jgi:hypothetical protein